MYWQFGSNKIAAPTIPLYLCGSTTDLDFTLVTEEGDDIISAYLAVNSPSGAGILQAKIGSGAFEPIGALGDPSCWLGSIPDEVSTAITIRLALSLGHDDGLFLPMVQVIIGSPSSSPFVTDSIVSLVTDTLTSLVR